MNRCILFSKLTHSDDPECGLFEEILDRFFDEYSSMYGAMDSAAVVDNIAEIDCLDNNDTEITIEASFNGGVVADDGLATALESFITDALDGNDAVNVTTSDSDTILITLRKDVTLCN